jgi:hypothetical protein
MRRRPSLLWIPLLAALLAGHPAQRLPAGVTEAVVGQLATSTEALGLPRTVRFQVTPDGRSSLDRHGGPNWALLPDVEPGATVAAHQHGLEAGRHHGLLPESSRHFPLFPTGPPRHS